MLVAVSWLGWAGWGWIRLGWVTCTIHTTTITHRLRTDLHVALRRTPGPVLDDVAAFVDERAVTRAREEGGNTGAARPQALGQRALRRELHLQLAAQVLTLEGLVLADVRRAGGPSESRHPVGKMSLQRERYL